MTAKGSLEYGGLTIPGATKQATAIGDTEADRARRAVALASLGVDDRAKLLDMLGLVPDGKTLTVVIP